MTAAFLDPGTELHFHLVTVYIKLNEIIEPWHGISNNLTF